MIGDSKAFAYFKHDGGFGYGTLQVNISSVGRNLVNFTLVAIGGESNYRTLNELVNGLRDYRDMIVKDGTAIFGYLNVVTDLAKRDTKNPKRLEPNEEAEFMRQLFQ